MSQNILEHALLFHIKTHLPPESASFSRLFISGNPSNELLSSIGGLFPSLEKIDRDTTKKPQNSYDIVIILSPDSSPLSKYLKHLPLVRENGILLFARHFPLTISANKALSMYDDAFPMAQFTPLFSEWVGKPFAQANNPVQKVLNKIPNNRVTSPYEVSLYQKKENTQKYVSHFSIKNRLRRASSRIRYKVENHKVNDYIVAFTRNWVQVTAFLKRWTFVDHYRFNHNISPTIPTSPPSKPKIKVAVVLAYVEMGGVERVALNILKDLDPDLFEVHLLTTIRSVNKWHDVFTPHVHSITHIPDIVNTQWNSYYIERYLEEYIRNNNFDVLFISNSEVAYKSLPKIKKGIPTIRVYDLLHTHGTPRDKDAYLRLSVPYDRYITKRVVIDEYLKDYYCTRYPIAPDKVLVIYNGMDKQSLSNKGDDAWGKQILKKQPKEVAITFIGRLEVDKSPIRLVEIAHSLKGRSDAVIYVAGDGTLRQQMEQYAHQYGIMDTRIRFLGYVEDTLSLSRASDYTILTSNSEGIPMSVLESMNCGTPAIAPAVGGIPEMIDNGIDGFLVDIQPKSDETEKLALFITMIEKALKLSDKDRSVMAQMAQIKVKTKFSHMAEDYTRLLQGKLDE